VGHVVRTHGLTHVSLSVADPDAALAFYGRLFGVRECVREVDTVQALGPGPHDVLVFERRQGHGVRGGIDHIGFRLTDPADIHQARAEADALGATIVRQGEWGPGLPYLFLLDPDGNEIEIWYE